MKRWIIGSPNKSGISPSLQQATIMTDVIPYFLTHLCLVHLSLVLCEAKPQLMDQKLGIQYISCFTALIFELKGDVINRKFIVQQLMNICLNDLQL